MAHEVDPESLLALLSPPSRSDALPFPLSPKESNSSGTVALLVVGWYSAAIACVTSSKRVLLAVPFPLLLCLAQFTVSAIMGYILQISGAMLWTNTHKHKRRSDTKGEEDGHRQGVALSRSDQKQIDQLVIAIALSYCLGFICTNISFSLVSANFAETIKAGEPISSVLLGFTVLQQSYSLSSYGYLLVICLGVSLSCVGTDDFGVWGFFFAGE